MMMRFIRKPTVQPYSFPDPRQRRKTSDYWITVAVLTTLLAGLFVTARVGLSDAQLKPKVALKSSDWKSNSQASSDSCDTRNPARGNCPGSTTNQLLWESPLNRDSKEFNEHIARASADPYWIGIKIQPETLQAADRAQASRLILPQVNGVVQVWVDGLYQTTYDYSQQRIPLQITVSRERLLDPRELAVVLSVFPFPHQPPSSLTSTSESEGFYTPIEADRFARTTVFKSVSRHLIAVSLFLLLAGFLWSASAGSRTRDFVIGTQLALLIAIISLLSVDLSFRIFNISNYESIYFALLFLEALFVSRFTWTILRGSKTTRRLEGLLLSAGLIVPIVIISPLWIETSGAGLMTSFILPVTYLTCAASLGYRLFILLNLKTPASRTRVEFVAVATLSLALTGFSYFYEAHLQSGFQVIWSRWLNVILLLGLVRVFTRSRQTKSSLIEMSPTSRHHRMDPPPVSVEGWILCVDVLKFSSDRQVISTVLSHLWTISQLHGGEVIQADERSLHIIFENSDPATLHRRFVKTLGELSKCAKDLEQRLPIVFPSKDFSTSILFRAAAAQGSLAPSWQSGESTLSKRPTWLELAPGHVLQALKNLMATDLDSALRSNDSSILVMSQKDADCLADSGVLSKRSQVHLDSNNDVVAFIANRIAAQSNSKDSKVS